jgi:predicted kinase
MRPLVVLVSGAPGSGKSTLAKNLADYMKLPHIERDRISTGIDRTRGAQMPRSETIPVFFELASRMLNSGVSFVTDGTLYKNVSEKDTKTHLIADAFVVNVHARADNVHRRFYEREMNREGWSSDWVEAHMGHLQKIYPDTKDPLDLGVEVIEVDTNDGYEPSIAVLARRITELYALARQEEAA